MHAKNGERAFRAAMDSETICLQCEARDKAARKFCDPSRVELMCGRLPGVAACGLTPGYRRQPFRLR